MSRNPGLGRSWYNKFRSDLYPDGFTVINGFKCRIPKYYDKLYEAEEPEDFADLVDKRKKHMRSETAERLSTIEKHKLLTLKAQQERSAF